MDPVFEQFDSWIVALVLAVAMFGGWAIGWWLGGKTSPDAEDKSAAKFVDSTLAILGLLLGFTFAIALDKHEKRRELIIVDSNSIADFYTCATLLKEPIRGNLQDIARKYVDIRLNVARTNPDPATVEKAIKDSQDLQNQMTSLTRDAIDAGTPIAIPLTESLNGLTSSHASLLAAMRDRLPWQVILLLTVAAVISTILVGKYHEVRKRYQLGGTLCYVTLVCMAVFMILDLNNPNRGIVQVSVEPLERLAASIAK
jgi:hypothetical protein